MRPFIALRALAQTRWAALVASLSAVACTPSTGSTGPGNVPTSCVSDRDCSGAGLLCNRASARCVECNVSGDCLAAGQVCVSNRCIVPTNCTSARMCPGQVCDTARGYCVDCVNDVDCPAGQRCSDAACIVDNTSNRCQRDGDCVASDAPFCDTLAGACVGCLNDGQCGAGRTCASRTCVQLPPTRACEPNAVTCRDATTLRRCNGDGTSFVDSACAAMERCANGRCEAPRVCTPGEVSCANGTAQRLCNSTGTTYTDVPCPGGGACSAGTCATPTVVCTPGELRCAGTSARRVCNASGTGFDETPCPPSQPYCITGSCSATCAAGRGDCDGDPSNGCEVSLVSTSHCGRCGNTCDAGQSCRDGACTTGTAGCGANGQGCCFGGGRPLCDSGLGCQMNVCRPGTNCGANNIRCCSGRCNTGLTCDPSTDRCQMATCTAIGQPCAAGASCCGESTCREQLDATMRCCLLVSTPCTSSSECCNGMSCAPDGTGVSHCRCKGAGAPCVSSDECCGLLVCNGAHVCG